MKRENLIKRLEDILLSGKDPFDISYDLADFIETNYKPKKKAANPEIIADTEKWINDWIELFPEGHRSGGKLVRSDKKICLAKMIKFREDYPEYDVDDIMNATLRYVANSLDSGAYMSCAVNFIQHRDKGSELAASCRELKTNKNIKSESSVNEERIASYFL